MRLGEGGNKVAKYSGIVADTQNVDGGRSEDDSQECEGQGRMPSMAKVVREI